MPVVTLVAEANCYTDTEDAWSVWIVPGPWGSDEDPDLEEHPAAVRVSHVISGSACKDVMDKLDKLFRKLGHEVNATATADD